MPDKNAHRKPRRACHQRTISGLCAAIRVIDDAFPDPELLGRHMPLRRGGREQHRARLGARFTQLHPGIGHRRTAAGPLEIAEGQIGIALRVGRSALDAHQRPVGIELIGKHGGDAGVGALAHLDVLGDDRDGVVCADAHEGVRSELRAGRHRLCHRAARGSCPFETDRERECARRAGSLEKCASRRASRAQEWIWRAHALMASAASWMAARIRP